MADNSQIPERFPDLSDPRQRHESRDVNIWAISKVGVGLVITTLASAAIVWGLFAYLRVQYNAQPPERGIDVNAMKWPSSPNLLYNVDEAKNQADYRSAEEQTLNGYSWVDQQHTQIKIPAAKRIAGSQPAAGACGWRCQRTYRKQSWLKDAAAGRAARERTFRGGTSSGGEQG
jgi:hypothetical protein